MIVYVAAPHRWYRANRSVKVLTGLYLNGNNKALYRRVFLVLMQFITLSSTLKRTVFLKLRLHICGIDTVLFDKLSKSPPFLASDSRGLRDIAAGLAHDLQSIVMLEGT
jgi:hypothetical protein